MNIKEMRKEIRKVYPDSYVHRIKYLDIDGLYMYVVYENKSKLNTVGFGHTVKNALKNTLRMINSTSYGVEKG